MDRVLVNSSKRVTCGYLEYNGHFGIDIGYSVNEEDNKVFANSKGVVYEVQDGLSRNLNAKGKETWGNFVLVKHPNGMFTRYAHLLKGSIKVSLGQEVDENTCLGIVGDSGITYGRHLHFEVATGYSSGTRINPTEYLVKAIYEENDFLEEFNVGDKVLLICGRATECSDGSGNVTLEYDGNIEDVGNIKYITLINKGAVRPYHVSNDKENTMPRGWVYEKQMKKI